MELIGFVQRVIGDRSAEGSSAGSAGSAAGDQERVASPDEVPVGERSERLDVRTEVVFEFHRLGVLLLRAADVVAGQAARKIATATLGEARIRATLGECTTGPRSC